MSTQFYFLFALMAVAVLYPISAWAETEIPDWVKQVAEFWITD